MSDSGWVTLFCGKSQRYSAVTWATGFKSPTEYIGARTGQYLGWAGYMMPYWYDAPQDMGWDSARTYLYDGLKSNDPALREENFVKTFKAVGQVMHLLQDMAVPAHARNDMESHLFNSYNPTKWMNNQFEKYVVTHSDAINNSTDTDKPTFAIPTRVTDFWDKNVYIGDNPTNGTNQGLAEYSNANFFSNSTILKNNPSPEHYFPNPQITNANYICSDKLPGSTKITKYVSRTACPTDGSPVDHFAAVSLLNRKGTLIASLKNVWLDDNVHDTYVQQILPRAVSYSAALLDYFFRGNIKITTNPTDITFRSVKVTAENNTPGETMGAGEVRLVIGYKELSEWPLGGNKSQLNYPSDGTNLSDYTYRVSAPQNVDLTNPQELTFDFSDDPLPYFFDDLSMQLVYKGKLGNEDGAVAVSPITPIDGIYTDFLVSLPPYGVYAKTADGTLGATFNELKVTAQSDIPGGLSGGSFALALEYRETGGDPFQSLPVDTEPANAAAYVIRVAEKNGVNTLPPGTPVELVFDLSQVPISVRATDVHLNVIYTDPATSKPIAIGYRDISEPTPVDVFNNADKICINTQWYDAGSPDAVALADNNSDDITDLFDPYAHTIANIYAKASSTTNITPASASNFTFSSADALEGGSFRRLGYILTDYSFSRSFLENWINVNPDDPWTIIEGADQYPSTAVKNQTEPDGNYVWPGMFVMRGYPMWWGASVIYDNYAYPANASCDWSAL